MTEAQERAMNLATENGIVCAGGNVSRGCLYVVNRSTIAALIRRRQLKACFSPEGGYAGKPVAPICVDQEVLSDALIRRLYEADMDELAQYAELAYGGTCVAFDDHFELRPDPEIYSGVFGELEE